MRCFHNFAFMSEKKRRVRPQCFKARVVSGQYNCLENLSTALNATTSAIRVFAKREEQERI